MIADRIASAPSSPTLAAAPSGAAAAAAAVTSDIEAPPISLAERAAADTQATPLLLAAPQRPRPAGDAQLADMAGHLAYAGAGLALATGSALLTQPVMRPLGKSFVRLLLPPALVSGIVYRYRPLPLGGPVAAQAMPLAAGVGLGIWLGPELVSGGSPQLIYAMMNAFAVGSSLGILATVAPWRDYHLGKVTALAATLLFLSVPLRPVEALFAWPHLLYRWPNLTEVQHLAAFPVATILAGILPHYLMHNQARSQEAARPPWPLVGVRLAFLGSLLATCTGWVGWPPGTRTTQH